jgi:hypothetical protein
MYKKIIGILVCILFFGVSVTPSISSNIIELNNMKNVNNFENEKLESVYCPRVIPVSNEDISIKSNKHFMRPALDNIAIMDDQLDQYQYEYDDEDTGWAIFYDDNSSYAWVAQSFKPTLPKLTRVRLWLFEYGNMTCDIIVSIRSDINGSDLVSISKSPNEIPDWPNGDWVEFDFPDININVDWEYFIVCKTYCGEQHISGYAWVFGYYTSYTKGDTWFNNYVSNQWYTDWGSDCIFETYGYVWENQDPVADFDWSPSSPEPSETITFDASDSYDPDGTIELYEWDWDNDGTYDESHTTPTATHTWDDEGDYPVTLKVTDNNSGTDNVTKTIQVTENGYEEPIEGTIDTEGFEDDNMPPANWSHLAHSNNTWDVGEGDFYAHSGNYGAFCHSGNMGEPQDEWLISPALDLSSMNNIVLSFWWKSDYTKMVEQDNFDVFVKISVDNGSSWDTIWTSGDIGEFTSWEWYNTSIGVPISLDDYEDESEILLAWQFYGEDTADFILDEILIVGIMKVPVLNLVNIKGGIGQITGELENSGEVTPNRINWNMEVVIPDVGPIKKLFRGLLFSPKQKEWKTTDTRFSLNMLGLGQATVNIGYKYISADIMSVKEVDVRGRLLVFLGIIQEPTRTWVKIDPQDVVYEESQSPPYIKAVNFYFDIETWHNVRVCDSDSSDILFQGSCSFDGVSGTLKESFITKATVTSGNAYWEVELVDGE